jgi:hypothetical protein
MQKNQSSLQSSKVKYRSDEYIKQDKLYALKHQIKPKSQKPVSTTPLTFTGSRIKPSQLFLTCLLASSVGFARGSEGSDKFEIVENSNNVTNFSPLKHPSEIFRIRKKFFNKEISDSKIAVHEGKNYVVKAHGGEVAEVHDKILRDLGLVIDEVTDLKKVRVKIVPSEAYNGAKVEPIVNVIGQAREKMNIEKPKGSERENFITENYKKFVAVSMMGVGISDLIQNPNNLVKFNDKITAIDVDATNFPVIPYYIFDRFGIDRNAIFESAQEFFKSDQYQSLKQLKLDSVLKVCGEDSDFYKIYLENFKKMEDYLDKKTTEYNPENTYFGNIRDIFSNPDGSVSINRNTYDLKREGPSLKFPREIKFDPNLPNQPYLLATTQAKSSVKAVAHEKLESKTKESREL